MSDEISVVVDDVFDVANVGRPSVIAHTHPATDISDSTVAGRAILTAADAASQRSSLGIDTTSNQTYTTSASGGVSRSVFGKLGDFVSVKDFGATGDGVTDDSAAIQAAINAYKSTAGYQPTQSIRIYFPVGTYIVGTAINVYSGIQLFGEGRKSLLKASGGLTGQILTIAPVMPDDAASEIVIDNLGFQSSGTVWAIKATASTVINSAFTNLVFNCGFCVSLATYSQSVYLSNWLSIGALDQFLKFAGNRNSIERLDKEGSTGSSSDPYIYIGAGSGNIIKDILIEQTTSANKALLYVRNQNSLIIDCVWLESTVTNGFAFDIADCVFVHVRGTNFVPFVPNQKAKVRTTQKVVFDCYFAESNSATELTSFIDVDSTSNVVLTNASLAYGGLSGFRFDAPNILIENFRAKASAAAAAHALETRPFVHGSNLLVNPSFVGGVYGWSDGGYTTGTRSSVSYGMDGGKALNILFGSDTTSLLVQTITISADMVGKQFVLTGYARLVSGAGWVGLFTSGCGTDTGNGNERVTSGTGWQLITRSIVPSSAGSLVVGASLVNVTEAEFANFSVCHGQHSVPDVSSFQMINLGGTPMTRASAAPTTGTWGQGSVVYNSAPASGGYVGWVCTAAGTPGTWKTFGLIS